MATNLVRFDNDGAAKWGVVAGSGVSPLEGDYPTTAALIERGEADGGREEAPPTMSLDKIKILSPVTAPCRIYCQGANYRQHMIESDWIPTQSCSTCSSRSRTRRSRPGAGVVTRPKHVALLDYEIELALVFRLRDRQAGDGDERDD